ncbi:MAG TPA: tetratricopeptide repeat protein [Candidatus Cloacimonadota bacterium]|nr:tetratricopeptide repeat protein [Candidatus Cloacimonadota bacterium]
MSKRLLPAGLVLGLLIVSCGLNNTMYNARKYFRSAQARPLNSNGKPTPQAIDEYTKTIQKCGVIITERKGSKIIDDALFLLARALYYKGNSAFQAKDQFEALIKGFPQSPHYPEAHIYLARVLRQINQPQEAEKLLESFVRDTRYLKFHPRALMVLAEFEIGDKDYLRAQYWLQRIITDYPGTPEFKEAYFLFGKNYYEQKDFAASLTEFERLVETRGISKELKLEGRYYIGLNHFELGDLERSGKIISALINDESRPDKLGQIRVLKARLLLAGADPQAGITEVDDLAKIYPRSMSSAAAYYYLGDHYFYRDGNIDQASTAYNKVRTEFPSSELVTASQAKVAALNQLKQNQSLSVTGNLQQFVDYHMLAADNYVNAFALPDSALMMYDRILQAAGPVRSKLDSLSIEALALQARADSLQIGITELETALAPAPVIPDSLSQPADKGETTPADSIVAEPEASVQLSESTAQDSSAVIISEVSVPDSVTQVEQPETSRETTQPESLEPHPAASIEAPDGEITDQPGSAIPDSVKTMEAKEEETADPRGLELQQLRNSHTQTQTDLASLDTRQKELEGILTRLDTEILPLVSFAKASLLKKNQAADEQLQAILNSMESSFPEHKYTNALRMLISGQAVRLADPEEDRQNDMLDNALGLYADQPDSMRAILTELSASQYSDIRLKANFRLAWMHSFELADTLAAKPYLDVVLNHPQGGDYATMARKFYDGKNFKFPKPAPDSTALPDSLDAEDHPAPPQDDSGTAELMPDDPDAGLEIQAESIPDSLAPLPQLLNPPQIPEPDSLSAQPVIVDLETPVVPDSLAIPAIPAAEPDLLGNEASPAPKPEAPEPGSDGSGIIQLPTPESEVLQDTSSEPVTEPVAPWVDAESEGQEEEIPAIPAPPEIPPGEPELE